MACTDPAIFEYIEMFCNRKRRRQSLDYLSPVEYEGKAGAYYFRCP